MASVLFQLQLAQRQTPRRHFANDESYSYRFAVGLPLICRGFIQFLRWCCLDVDFDLEILVDRMASTEDDVYDSVIGKTVHAMHVCGNKCDVWIYHKIYTSFNFQSGSDYFSLWPARCYQFAAYCGRSYGICRFTYYYVRLSVRFTGKPTPVKCKLVCSQLAVMGEMTICNEHSWGFCTLHFSTKTRLNLLPLVGRF
jgi:hypothetical protein